jgi:hypothetical protein
MEKQRRNPRCCASDAIAGISLPTDHPTEIVRPNKALGSEDY